MTEINLGLYLHVPFCVKKCHYCDFVSFPYTEEEADVYCRAVCKEMELYGACLPQPEKKVDSVFIGGGTPTSLPLEKLSQLLARINTVFSLTLSCEVTMEANPGTIDAVGLAKIRAEGVNRLSLGAQAFQDRLLKLLGRVHDVAAVTDAFHGALAAGFDNINLDLIYGIPTQTLAEWQATLKQAVQLSPAHIAAYGLQLEPGTPLAQSVYTGKLPVCPEELELEMYRTAMAFLTANGYKQYEISNFARPGRESKHNLKYWLNQPYLGFGPAAGSYYHGQRWTNERSLSKYAAFLDAGEKPVFAREDVSFEIEMAETMIMGLRLRQGIDLEKFSRRFGKRVEEVYGKEISALREAGLVEIVQGNLRLTEKGLPVGNIVFQEFV